MLVGQGRGTYTGTDVAIVPDVDGDGGADLVVTAILGGTSGSGAVFVLPGDTQGTVQLEDGATYRIDGATRGDALGQCVAAFGDSNGDGIEDVVLGATNVDLSAGAVYVVEGGFAPGWYTVDDVASAVVHATDAYSYFATGVVSADYDGDGTSDVFVGAWYDGKTGGYGPGQASAFLSPLAGNIVAEKEAVTTWVDSDAGVVQLSAGLAAGGDVDGDGSGDVLLSSPGAGRAYLQLGLISGTVEVSELAAFTGAKETGTIAGVDFLSDWDGDGCDEIALGSWNGTNSDGLQSGIAAVVTSSQLR